MPDVYKLLHFDDGTSRIIRDITMPRKATTKKPGRPAKAPRVILDNAYVIEDRTLPRQIVPGTEFVVLKSVNHDPYTFEGRPFVVRRPKTFGKLSH
jgi:hypothetical protein